MSTGSVANSRASVNPAFIRRIETRAARLFLDERRVEPVAVACFRILCPTDPRYVPKTVRVCSAQPYAYACDCRCYQQHALCKHGLGLPSLIRWQLADYQARLRQARAADIVLDNVTRRLLTSGADPWRVAPGVATRLDYANRLDSAAWDLRAAWAQTCDPHADCYLPDSPQGWVAEEEDL